MCDPCAVAGELSSGDAGINVHVIGFNVSDRTRRQLQCIAEKGQGEYFDARNAEEFRDAVAFLHLGPFWNDKGNLVTTGYFTLAVNGLLAFDLAAFHHPILECTPLYNVDSRLIGIRFGVAQQSRDFV